MKNKSIAFQGGWGSTEREGSDLRLLLTVEETIAEKFGRLRDVMDERMRRLVNAASMGGHPSDFEMRLEGTTNSGSNACTTANESVKALITHTGVSGGLLEDFTVPGQVCNDPNTCVATCEFPTVLDHVTAEQLDGAVQRVRVAVDTSNLWPLDTNVIMLTTATCPVLSKMRAANPAAAVHLSRMRSRHPNCKILKDRTDVDASRKSTRTRSP